jgi:hypothetical protein
LSLTTDGGNWPAASFEPDLGFAPVDFTFLEQGVSRPLQVGDCLAAYLESWERHITGIEDPGIVEQALGNNQETCSRTLTVGQVKLVPALGLSPDQVRAAFQNRRPGTGTLTINTAPVVEDPDPCALPASGGYTGRDHRLYRFEVHQGGSLADTVIKWSRNNGSELVPVQSLNAAQLEVLAGSPLKDGDLVEILSETIDLRDATLAVLAPATNDFTAPTRAVGDLVRLRDEGIVSSGTRQRFSFRDRNDESIPFRLSDLDRYGTPIKLKVRRWQGTLEPSGAATPFETQIESGISISLAGTFEVGDWWQYEARVGRDNANGLWQELPHGPERAFAPLALLEFQGAAQPLTLVAWLDERFPSLCSLDADDIPFDGDRVNSSGDTVQEVIEELWSQVQSCGEIIARPTDNLQTVFNSIPEGESAKICLHPGVWNFNATVTVADKGDVVVSGAGFGTQLNSSTVDPVLVFSNCRSVTVRDLSVQGGAAGVVGDGLRGAISFVDCESVTLEHAQVICGAATSRRMSAVQVWTRSPSRPPTDVCIAKCRVQAGHSQTGILIVNAGQVSLTANEVEAPANDLVLADMVTDPIVMASIGRVFIDRVTIGETEEANDKLLVNDSPNIVIVAQDRDALGRQQIIAHLEEWGFEFITFSTQDALDNDVWQEVFTNNPIQLRSTSDQARQAILATKLRQLRSGLARNLLGIESSVTIPSRRRSTFDSVINQVINANPVTTGSQGIVIGGDRTPRFGTPASRRSPADGLFINGGDRAPDVSINNNRIVGFVQGIHVGTSGDERNRSLHLRSYNVHISNNTVQLRLPSLAQERHGIFVGHAHTVQIQNNLVEVTSPTSSEWPDLPPTDGIRLYGVYGPRLQVRQNHCIGVRTGVRVHARNAGKQETHHNIVAAWMVVDNAYAGFGSAESLNAEPLDRF